MREQQSSTALSLVNRVMFVSPHSSLFFWALLLTTGLSDLSALYLSDSLFFVGLMQRWSWVLVTLDQILLQVEMNSKDECCVWSSCIFIYHLISSSVTNTSRGRKCSFHPLCGQQTCQSLNTHLCKCLLHEESPCYICSQQVERVEMRLLGDRGVSQRLQGISHTLESVASLPPYRAPPAFQGVCAPNAWP